MKRVWFPFLLCVLLLAGFLCMAGCVQDQAGREAVNATPRETTVITTSPNPTTIPAPVHTVQESATKTCSQLGGDLCSDDKDCSGSWLDAADSFSCCSLPCSGTAGAVFAIEPFVPLPAFEEQESIRP